MSAQLAPKPWPKLSESLTHERRPDRCQSCGWDCDLKRWREHDDFDRPTATVVVLCLKCGKVLIEKHPRLYASMHDYEPLPGSMVLCEACRFRDGVSCTHPDVKANGGPGLMVTVAKPHTAFVCIRGRGKNKGGPVTIWPGPPTACAGREENINGR